MIRILTPIITMRTNDLLVQYSKVLLFRYVFLESI
jgi:hypothetical protein